MEVKLDSVPLGSEAAFLEFRIQSVRGYHRPHDTAVQFFTEAVAGLAEEERVGRTGRCEVETAESLCCPRTCTRRCRSAS